MEALLQRITQQLGPDVHRAVSAFAAHLGTEAGASAALFYGSNLRTGELEGVLDFYLLMPGAQQEKIWPRVSYHEWEYEGIPLRAKVARMSLSKFAEAASGASRDTTIWARFVQPSALVWLGEPDRRPDIVAAIAGAARTAARLAATLGPAKGTEAEYWRALFQATYKAEFRVEKAGREDSILTLNADHFDGLLPLALDAEKIPFERDGDIYRVALSDARRAEIRRWWSLRRRLGKPLNLIRLVKATTTFEGAGRYAAWKVQRHTGVPIEVTPWREKHPILAAPGVLFKVWQTRRKGG